MTQPGRTDSYRDITVVDPSHTWLYRHEPRLDGECSVVNRELTWARIFIDMAPVRHEDNVGTTRTHFSFLEKSLLVQYSIPAVLHRGVPGQYRHCDKEEIKTESDICIFMPCFYVCGIVKALKIVLVIDKWIRLFFNIILVY